MVELLAPAGNFISLTSALKNGADAVYFGLEDVNMRVNASNFSLEDIKKANEISVYTIGEQCTFDSIIDRIKESKMCCETNIEQGNLEELFLAITKGGTTNVSYN